MCTVASPHFELLAGQSLHRSGEHCRWLARVACERHGLPEGPGRMEALISDETPPEVVAVLDEIPPVEETMVATDSQVQKASHSARERWRREVMDDISGTGRCNGLAQAIRKTQNHSESPG